MPEKLFSEFVAEQSESESDIIDKFKTSLENLKESYPNIYDKFDISSLRNMEGFSDKEKLEHIESIKEELADNLSEERKKELLKMGKSGKTADWKLAAISLIALINSFGIEPAAAMPEKPAIREKVTTKTMPKTNLNEFVAQKQNKEKKFKLIKEITIEGKKYQFGIGTDDRGKYGKFEKYSVINEKGNDIFSDSESTWEYPLSGYYVGNLSKESPGPEILVWSKELSGFKKTKMEGRFYKYNPDKNKYEIYWKDYTDNQFEKDEKDQIIKSFLGKPSKYEQAYRIAKKYDQNINILSGEKPDNRVDYFAFPSKDRDANKHIGVFFDNGKIYLKIGKGKVTENDRIK